MDTGGQDGIRAAGKKSDRHDQRGTGKTGIPKRSHPVILSPVLSESLFDVQEGEEQMLHRLQHLPETWQEKLGDVGVTAKKSVSVFIFRNREVYMSMSMKSRMNLSGNWWNWLAGMAVPCRRSGNCSVNIRPMWNVRRSKMGNSTGCSGLRRMRKIPIIIVLRMRESISFIIVFCRRITGSLESDENRHR